MEARIELHVNGLTLGVLHPGIILCDGLSTHNHQSLEVLGNPHLLQIGLPVAKADIAPECHLASIFRGPVQFLARCFRDQE